MFRPFGQKGMLRKMDGEWRKSIWKMDTNCNLLVFGYCRFLITSFNINFPEELIAVFVPFCLSPQVAQVKSSYNKTMQNWKDKERDIKYKEWGK